MSKHVIERSGYRVVRRGSVTRSPSPIDCPLCECVMIDGIDAISMQRTGCCYDCEVEVADRNREMWLAGWRPAGKQLDEIRSRRLSSPHKR
jgi:hypothetical protein